MLCCSGAVLEELGFVGDLCPLPILAGDLRLASSSRSHTCWSRSNNTEGSFESTRQRVVRLLESVTEASTPALSSTVSGPTAAACKFTDLNVVYKVQI